MEGGPDVVKDDWGLHLVISLNEIDRDVSVAEISQDATRWRIISTARHQRGRPSEVCEIGSDVSGSPSCGVRDAAVLADDVQGAIAHRHHRRLPRLFSHRVGVPKSQSVATRVAAMSSGVTFALSNA